MSTQIAVPWLVYEATIDGERIVDAFLRECGGLIPDEHRQWLLAEQRAHFDIWEVTSTEPGVAVSLRGLIFGKVRRVQERVGSRSVVAREAVLARVVDYEGASYFGGMSPRALPLAAAERVAQRAKRQAEKAGATRLDDRAGLTLVRAWTKAVADKQTTETGSREPLDVGV